MRAFNEAVTSPSEVWLYSSVPLEQRTWLLELNGLAVEVRSEVEVGLDVPNVHRSGWAKA